MEKAQDFAQMLRQLGPIDGRPRRCEQAAIIQYGIQLVLMHHEIGNDNEQLTAKDGTLVPLVDNLTGSYRPGSFALNYRSEPFKNRLIGHPTEKAHSYGSYTFGDPATPMLVIEAPGL